jgi:hypothetical protein
MGRLLRKIWLVVFLGACAGAPPMVQSPTELRATHGFVHASLGSGATVRLRSLAKGETYDLVSQAANGPYAYGLWVPEGQYEIVDLRASSGAAYAPVSVSRGRITDLGGIVRLEIGNYEFVRLPIRHPELAPGLQQATSALRPHLATTEPIEWRPSAPPQAEKQGSPPTNLGLIADLLMDYTRHVNKPPLNQQLKQAKSTEEFFRLAVATVPPLADEPGSDAEGRLYYGAELGQIRVRARNGEWTNLDTGTLQTITAVEVSGSKIVAGTARGEIRTSEDGRTWRRHFSFAPGETVADIDRIGDRWIVLTARLAAVNFAAAPGAQVQTADLFKVYSATGDDLAGMALLRELPLPDKVFVVRGMGARGQAAGGGWFVNVGSDLLRLDLATLQWSTSSPGHKVSGFNISPKTGLVTAYRQQGAFSKLNLTADQGRTWRAADTPPYIFYDVYFESPDKGLATRWSTGAFSASIEFMAYDPKADRWQKTYDAPPGCVRLLRDVDNVQRFCVTSGNSILNYVDGKWVAEFAVN